MLLVWLFLFFIRSNDYYEESGADAGNHRRRFGELQGYETNFGETSSKTTGEKQRLSTRNNDARVWLVRHVSSLFEMRPTRKQPTTSDLCDNLLQVVGRWI